MNFDGETENNLMLRVQFGVDNTEPSPSPPLDFISGSQTLDDFLLELDATILKKPQESQKVSKQLKRNHKDGECSICYSKIKKKLLVPRITCKHIFHIHCLEKWRKLGGNCPLCRIALR